MVNTWTCRGTGSCGYQHNWFSHSYCWKCNEKYESVVSKAKRPREQRIIDADPGSSELVKAKQAVAKLEAACAADPDDAEPKELYERKKQRLELLESERATPFNLQEKLQAIGEKRDKKRKHAETVHEKARKAQEEAQRIDQELAECEDQYRQVEQRHRAATEQFTREQQRSLQENSAFQPLAVCDVQRVLQAEIRTDAAANSAVEHLLLVCQQKLKDFEAQSKPIVDDEDAEMADGVGPTPDEIERSGRELREPQKRHEQLLRRNDDAKCRKVEQSDKVGSGGSSFRGQA